MSLSLYPQGEIYKQVNAMIEAGNLTDDELQRVVDQQIGNELVAQEKAELIANDLLNLEAFIEGADKVAKDIIAKKAKAVKHYETIKRGILNYLALKDQKVLEAGIHKFRRQRSERLEITDENKVPGEYKEVRQEIVTKKAELKADIKDGKIKPEDSGVVIIENWSLRFE